MKRRDLIKSWLASLCIPAWLRAKEPNSPATDLNDPTEVSGTGYARCAAPSDIESTAGFVAFRGHIHYIPHGFVKMQSKADIRIGEWLTADPEGFVIPSMVEEQWPHFQAMETGKKGSLICCRILPYGAACFAR